MSPRAVAILAKLRRALYSTWVHLGLIKYVLVAFVLALLAGIVSVVVWSRVRPIAEYRPLVEKLVRERFYADRVEIKSLAFAWDWTTLSVGLVGESASFTDLRHGIDASVPRLTILWSPLKLFLGSVSITYGVDNSVWQFAPSETKTATSPRHEVSMLKGLRQPNFFQKRVDVHVVGENLEITMATPRGEPAQFKGVSARLAFRGTHSYFDGWANAHLSKNSRLGKVSGELDLNWRGTFQFVDQALVGVSVDNVRIDFSKSVIDGWALYKNASDPLHAEFGVQMLVNEDGDFTTVDFRDGKLKFADLNFVFDGDQKNASGAAFRWVLQNRQFERNHLPFQIMHQARASGPVQAEGRVEITKGWDLSSVWSVRANGINFKAVELADQFDPRSEGSVVFNLAVDGGFNNGQFYSSGCQLKIDAKDASLIARDRSFKKPSGQNAQVQLLFDITDDVLALKPSFSEWADFRVDVYGRIESLSGYLLRDEAAPFQIEGHSAKVDISKMAPLLNFLRQNPVPAGIVEIAGAVSGSLGQKSLAEQFEAQELAWRIDHLSVSAFRAGADSGAWFAKEKDAGYSLDGIVEANLSLRARGRGYLVQTSSLQANVDLTDAEVVWADQFRKPSGVAGSLKVGLTSVPNKIEVKSSRLSFLDNDIEFAGTLSQGSRSRIALAMAKPIDLSAWRGFFRTRDDIPLAGSIESKLYLSLLTTPDQMDGGIDWRRVGIAGALRVKHLRGFHGGLAIFDETSGDLRIGDGKIHLDGVTTAVGGKPFTLTGTVQPRGQRGAISFYDLASARDWDARLAVRAPELDIGPLLRALYPAAEPPTASTSLAPRAWLDPREMARFQKWPLLDHLKLRATFEVGVLKLGTSSLEKARGNVDFENFEMKYGVESARYGKAGSLAGAGVWNLRPRGDATGSLPISGTWNVKSAPLGALLAAWDMRDSKALRGLYTGSLIYSLEKSTTDDTRDVAKINLSGKVSGAEHAYLKLVRSAAADALREIGVASECFAPQWSGTLTAWSGDGDTLNVDQAEWQSGGHRLQWTTKSAPSGGAVIDGKWMPSAACLGAVATECWALAAPGGKLGTFRLRGAWDKLKFAWEPNAWATARECQQNRMAGANAPANDAKDAARLKTYLQKNAN